MCSVRGNPRGVARWCLHPPAHSGVSLNKVPPPFLPFLAQGRRKGKRDPSTCANSIESCCAQAQRQRQRKESLMASSNPKHDTPGLNKPGHRTPALPARSRPLRRGQALRGLQYRRSAQTWPAHMFCAAMASLLGWYRPLQYDSQTLRADLCALPCRC